MKHHRNRIGPEPPPLVPQSVRGWLSPLGKALLAAIGVMLCSLAVLATRQGPFLTDTAARHH